jgi:hypothetical protein
MNPFVRTWLRNRTVDLLNAGGAVLGEIWAKENYHGTWIKALACGRR